MNPDLNFKVNVDATEAMTTLDQLITRAKTYQLVVHDIHWISFALIVAFILGIIVERFL